VITRRFLNQFSGRSGRIPSESDGTILAIAPGAKGAPMSSTSQIGPSITVKGDITADEPLTIAGRVEGTVSIDNHAVTVDPAGHVKGDLLGDSLIVSGHINGSLVASTRIVVRETAVIEGSLSAPILNVIEGAQVTAKVDVTGQKKGSELKLAS
jgi:cytoskeletal protein CcmA (bactofilin family)